jgi:hypothetical protein
MQLWAVNILFYYNNTQHVSGALTPIIRSTNTVVTATGMVFIPLRWESYKVKPLKINLNLQLPHASVAWPRWHVVAAGYRLFLTVLPSTSPLLTH